MSYEQVLYDVADRVATITLNRPDRLNAWTEVMERELRSCIEAAAKDPSVRAIVITGAGRGFCAGADMTGLSGIASGDRARPAVANGDTASFDANFSQRFSYMLRVGKPIIAAINGPVAGMGFCLILFCDLRYAAEGARFTTAFARRGLIAEHGMSWMLPRVVGNMNALDILFSGRQFDAAEAERMGLARTLPAENFAAHVHKAASDLVSASSPRSIAIMKRQVYESMFQNLAEAWRIADDEMIKSLGTDDFKEGVAHFLEKRAPSFPPYSEH